jgi:hypothetical protein
MKKPWLIGLLFVGVGVWIILAPVNAQESDPGDNTQNPNEETTFETSEINLGVSQNLTATTSITITRTRDDLEIESLAPQSPNQELGSDFMVSSMGPYLDPDYDALNPAVAYNSQNNQYLVVWSGSDDIIGEYEIWGQRVNAATGAQIGTDFQISFVGTADDPAIDAEDPAVAYNSATNEYLVVWSADHYADGDFEIWGRRINAATGGLLGSMMRISVMGPGVDPDYDALNPAVAYNSTENQFLVVWEADDDTAPLVNNEFEIWGRRLSASGEWLDADIVRLSEMGGLGDANYDAQTPSVAYNTLNNEYMLVWSGDKSAYDAVNDEFEIWGQRLNASLGKMGAAGFRISDVGTNADPDRDAYDPSIAYSSGNNQYLVVWEGDDYDDNMYDVLGQRLEANGIATGSNDFYLSSVSGGTNSNYDALNPAVTYDRVNHEYLVVWQDDVLNVGEFEIWGQRISASDGSQSGYNTRMSDMGPDGDASYIAQTPALAYSGVSNNQFLIVWSGDNSIDGEFDIWGQRWTNGYKINLPLVIR